MTITILNCRAVQPFVQSMYLTVDQLTSTIDRSAIHSTFTSDFISPINQISLSVTPIHIEQVSIFVDGFRIINSSLDFGNSWVAYQLNGSVITFTNPMIGRIDVFVDNPWTYEMPDEYYVSVSNVQGAKTPGTQPGDLYAGLFCEPMILTMPNNGFVRLTDDRLRLVYIPNQNFYGRDTFSYTVLTDRGQIADPKCVYIKINQTSPAI